MSTRVRLPSTRALALATAAAFTPALAQAQTVTTANQTREEKASTAASPVAVSDIVVTAQKRREKLRNVPASVTSVSATQLQANGQITARDLADTVPGLQVGGSLGSGEFVIRGISSGQDLNPTVATQIDGVPIGPVSSGSVGAVFIPELDPSILQRVEVLRGPQGTLYGAATLGGIINYVTQKPDPNAVSGSFYSEGFATEHGSGSGVLRGSLNIPIVRDMLALQVSGFKDSLGGYINATQRDDKHFDFHRSQGGRAALLLQATPDLTIQLAHIYSNLQSRNDDITYNATTRTSVAGDLDYSQFVNPDFNSRFNMTSLNADYDLHWATLSYIGSYQTQDNFSELDYASGALAPILGILPAFGGATFPTAPHIGVPQTETADKTTQELRLSSSGDTRLRWLGGFFYNHERSDFLENIDNFDQTGQVSAVPVEPLLKYDLYTHLTEVAGFGNVTYYITPKLDITGGLRMERVTQDYRETYGGTDSSALNLLFNHNGYSAQPADSGKSTSGDTVLNYLFDARYGFTPRVMTYFRFATGYRPGGPNLIVPNLPSTYRSDQTYDYEVGLKTNYWGDKGYLDLSNFYIDWNNIQILTASEGLNGETNGGSATSKGVEASAYLQPINHLNLAATLTYTDAHLDQNIPYAPDGLSDGQGAQGDQLLYVPKWSASFSADYNWPWFDNWRGFAGGVVRYADSRQSVFEHTVVYIPYRLPSYVVVNLRLGIRKMGVELTAFVRNLGDERDQIGAYTTGGTDVVVGRPRSYGVSLGYKF